MAGIMPANGNRNKDSWAKVFTAIVVGLNFALAIAVTGMFNWWACLVDKQGADVSPLVDPYLLHRMLRWWSTLPLIWVACLVATSLSVIACQGRSCDRLSKLSLYTGAISLCLLFFCFAGFVHDFPGRQKVYRITCASNIKQIEIALRAYELDYNGYLPKSANWNKAVAIYTKSNDVLVCRTSWLSSPLPSYSLNRTLAGRQIGQLTNAAGDIMIYESKPGMNLSGGPELLPTPPRHSGGTNIGFADGHVRWYSNENARKLTWEPDIPGTRLRTAKHPTDKQ